MDVPSALIPMLDGLGVTTFPAPPAPAAARSALARTAQCGLGSGRLGAKANLTACCTGK